MFALVRLGLRVPQLIRAMVGVQRQKRGFQREREAGRTVDGEWSLGISLSALIAYIVLLLPSFAEKLWAADIIIDMPSGEC